MQKYDITGMSCAACQARVEKAVNAVEGVTSCSVSLLTNSMGVEGNASVDNVIKAVEDAGYGANLQGQDIKNENNNEIDILKKRLCYSLIILIILMYFSMGHMMWGFPIPQFFENHTALALLELLLAILVMVINQKFFISGFKSLFHLSPNMDTLVALGSSAAFIYSTVILFLMVSTHNEELIMSYAHDLYFESAAMIPTLITIGKLLEAISKGRTTNALKGLMNLAPKKATILKNDEEIIINMEEVQVNDIFVVKPGESIPVDGVIIEGMTAVDESALTGESQPVDKSIGDSISQATINQSGYIKAKATRIGKDTTLSQIIQMVNDASMTKAPIARIADKVSGIFVPVVIGIALITFIVWLILGESISFAMARGISVLVISCPCALGLATPVAIMVGNGVGAKNGILFKTSESLENLGKVDIIALDKTGTVTKGEPEVTDIIPANNINEKQFMQIVYSLERYSEHPLSKRIIDYCQNKNYRSYRLEDFKAVPGKGITGKFNGMYIYGGNINYIQEHLSFDEYYIKQAQELALEGKTPLLFSTDRDFLGIVAVADVIKEDSAKAIQVLKDIGIKVVMLTGDNHHTALKIARDAHIDDVISDVLPNDKERYISSLKNEGMVAMVGDGINDAPSLTRADVGVAIGTGTDIAIDSGDVVVMNSRLSDVVAAIHLSRSTVRNIHENLFWAFFYNAICIPVAAGIFIGITGWKMNPMLGAAAMSLSSFFVCMNALRLNLVNVYDDKKIIKRKKKEKKTMKKELQIEGMMCMHCENTVKKALEAIDGVDNANVSYEENNAVVTLSKDVDDSVLKKAVEDKDYQVISIK